MRAGPAITDAVWARRTACALMVMPRSRSMSIESEHLLAHLPLGERAAPLVVSRSGSVDLPWSMCAMIAKLRMRARSVMPQACITTVATSHGQLRASPPDARTRSRCCRASGIRLSGGRHACPEQAEAAINVEEERRQGTRYVHRPRTNLSRMTKVKSIGQYRHRRRVLKAVQVSCFSKRCLSNGWFQTR